MYPVLKRFVDQQQWLDALGDPLQKYIGSLFSNNGETGKQVKDALNGTWLGHPLHPMLTDVPVGAWTATFVLDTMGAMQDDRSLERSADITLTLGLAAAIGAAASGWTDWSDTYGEDRKLGLLHGLTMAATIVAYTGSLFARLAGARGAGKTLATTGYALLSAGAYLGGDEVYDLGYGVKRTAFEHPPTEYVAVMPAAELEDGKPTKGNAKGTPVLLVKRNEQIFALGDTCVHAGCSLSGGKLENNSIICPCHGSQFDLRDGSVLHGPATTAEPHYDVRVQNEIVEVKLAVD